MSALVLSFQEIDKAKVALVGGKGANLGELAQVAGIHIPPGFCITTAAFQRIMGETPALHAYLDQLAQLKVEERAQISAISGALRQLIESVAIPADLHAAITQQLASLGVDHAYAVRSSATAEDLPTASFAGQQDTYLNVRGEAAILQNISKCWASLFTERAITYRLQNGFDHRKVYLAVVVHQMVFPQAAGILFTADPITGNRKVLSIDASFGLGEALVAGLVNPDGYKVRDGAIIDKQIAMKQLAIVAAPAGGTHEQRLAPDQQRRQVLTDGQIVQLAQLGRTIETHFGAPQDIEWCLADDTFSVVQSRPITTLFPVPEAPAAGNQANRVYISVAHQQMMTDPIKPLGLSFFLMVTRAPMRKAGGWLFVDVTPQLASPASREMLLKGMGQHDPLMQDALQTLIARGDFIQLAPDAAPAPGSRVGPPAGPPPPNPNDPTIVAQLIEQSQRSIAELQATIQPKTGLELLDFIQGDIKEAQKVLFDPQSTAVFMAAINASTWLNEKMQEWLGEKNAADTLSQSVPNNITSAMGLALLDVADALRPYPAVIAYLQQAKDDDFWAGLAQVHGGAEAAHALTLFLDHYGMRCAGEIDLTKARWREKPTTLVPMLLSNLKNFAPGESQRRFAQGEQEALAKAQSLLARLALLPDGQAKVAATQHHIDLLRNFIGYREYPKYSLVSRYWLYKQALRQEAQRLVAANVLPEIEDLYYLTFEELRDVVRTQYLDQGIISQRKDAYQHYEKLTPPRVITSDGEIITGQYKRNALPAGAIAGLPVSAGVMEGRARVILTMSDADLAEGDILVTRFTDPSWTPLFVAIKGLVTEVGGLMTHGAVIAREYGLPAVVGVNNATKLVKDGQRIRVNGTDGYVEILS